MNYGGDIPKKRSQLPDLALMIQNILETLLETAEDPMRPRLSSVEES